MAFLRGEPIWYDTVKAGRAVSCRRSCPRKARVAIKIDNDGDFDGRRIYSP